MSGEPQMFRINPDSRESEKITEVEFSRLGLQERRDIQEWIAANPGILGDDLLIIGKEFSGFDLTNERLDLLAVDEDGKLVIVELKRDDTGADAHWQAIKYASYFSHTSADAIVSIFANYAGVSEMEAGNRLMQHLNGDDLNALNHDQRIILASHRFAPEVTSAALWINGKMPFDNHDMITCIQLIPYQDPTNGALYLQASTIIPLPGADEYIIKVGDTPQKAGTAGSVGFGDKLRAAFQSNRNDEVTRFLRQVSSRVVSALPDAIKPNRMSKWGAGDDSDFRYYHFWYRHQPWGNWKLSYRVNLYQHKEPGRRHANVELGNCGSELMESLAGISLPIEHRFNNWGIVADIGDGLLDDEFAERIAQVVRSLIEQATPIVDDLENETDSLEI